MVHCFTARDFNAGARDFSAGARDFSAGWHLTFTRLYNWLP